MNGDSQFVGSDGTRSASAQARSFIPRFVMTDSVKGSGVIFHERLEK